MFSMTAGLQASRAFQVRIDGLGRLSLSLLMRRAISLSMAVRTTPERAQSSTSARNEVLRGSPGDVKKTDRALSLRGRA